ncbi:hypothetical protein ACIRP0_30510 [Streptomyces sp. NPDC101733]|uniref:hypothetical protein n=1 Tax=unclassified Streptomyces TaxID=2593676 RepID=UPI0038039B91
MSETDGPDVTDGTEATHAPEGPSPLEQAVLGNLMAVIGAPDDRETARTADAALGELDQHLRDQQLLDH